MKVYQVLFDVENVDKEITREECYWTAPSLFAACATASAHAYEYEKDFVSARYVLAITRTVDFKEGQQLVESCIDYGLLEGEGFEHEEPPA